MIEWVMLDTQNNEYITVKQARKKKHAHKSSVKLTRKWKFCFYLPIHQISTNVLLNNLKFFGVFPETLHT